MVKDFDFYLPVRIKFGAGSIDAVGQECSQLSAKKVLLVADESLVRTTPFGNIVDNH